MVRLFIEEFETILKNSKKIRIKNGIFITGTLFYPFLKSLLDKVNERFGSSLKAVPIKNEFLGESITVAGLLAGQDIIKQLSHLRGKEPIVLTNCMLKQDEDIFLDDVSLKELSKALKRKVIVVGSDGFSAAKAILK
jgi:NifB/MoaA-like Fe-S oxidoreductase